jgi:hypothetical protein
MKSLILSAALLLSSCYPASVVSAPKPSIYITRTDRVPTVDGRDVWILEYTVNGELQAPLFNSQKAMTEFREYLDTIGTVYRKEAE